MLYLVATPIGNLADISLRALETLRSVDIIAAEDTRHTGKLLAHYDIDTPQMPFHEHNEDQAVERVINALRGGESVAMVTDAGTPGISDPGFTLVRAAVQGGFAVTMIPGADAVTMAVVLSGLPTHSFTFRGFPPKKPGKRQKFLAIDADSPHTLVFYESPYRLSKLLADCITVYGDRPAALCNDMTKLYETVERGRLSALLAAVASETEARGKLRGEYVLVVAGAGAAIDWEGA
jgi:16S rRNA (cytidine1402-2'-O)-methyltransferase